MKSALTYSEEHKSIHKEFPSIQDEALQHFLRLGFPTKKNEEWRFTNITSVLSKDFSFAAHAQKISREEVENKFPMLKESSFVVVENGKINFSASSIKNLPAGIEIKSLLEVKNRPLIQRHYNLYADMQEDAFAALNTAYSNDGVVVFISRNATMNTPVYLVNISYSENEAVIMHDRVIVIAESGSYAKIGCINESINGISETFVNAQTEIFVDENAGVEYIVLQNENEKSFHINGTHVLQCANSKFSINTVSLGGKIHRNKLHIKLDGQNCETHMYGLYIAGSEQLIDNHTAVYHAKPNSNSNQLYKGIIGDKAHAVFNGKIFVEKDAQKTNAYQSNKNILLSDDAIINVKPQLEIFADDVKCTHGATTGQMDEDSLFYLRARGINEDNAKALLNLAFADDVLNKIQVQAFRNHIHTLVEQKLKNIL